MLLFFRDCGILNWQSRPAAEAAGPAVIFYKRKVEIMRRNARWNRLAALVLALMLSLSLAPTALAASGMSNFKKTRTYPGFSDVKEDAWYAADLKEAYELGLINGAGDGKFNPDGQLTLAEAITMAASVHATYYGNSFTPGGSPWYQNAVDYAIEVGFLLEDEYSDYRANATRADMAGLFAYTLPAADLARINRIAWIPDVAWNNDYIDPIYRLYSAGVLTGGEDGSFRPDDFIQRKEAVCILARMAVPSKRVSFSLDTPAPGTVTQAADSSYQLSVPNGWTLDENANQASRYNLFYAYTGQGVTAVQIDSFSLAELDTSAEEMDASWEEDFAEAFGATVNGTGRYMIREFSAYYTSYSYVRSDMEFERLVYTFETDQFVYSVHLIRGEETTMEQWQQAWEIVYSMLVA